MVTRGVHLLSRVLSMCSGQVHFRILIVFNHFNDFYLLSFTISFALSLSHVDVAFNNCNGVDTYRYVIS